MVEQDGTLLTDRVEDAPVGRQVRMVHRMVRRITEARDLQVGDLEEVAHLEKASALEHVLLFVQAQLGGHFAPEERIDPAGYLDANDRCEAPLAEARLDPGQQIFGVLFSRLRVGVPRDLEQGAAHDLHSGEQDVQVVGHHALERDEHVGVAEPHETRNPGPERHLHAGHDRVGLPGLLKADKQVERVVGDEWERVGGIQCLRGHQWVDALEVGLPQPPLLLFCELVPGPDADLVLFQFVQHLCQRALLLSLELAYEAVALADLLLGSTAVHGQVVNAGTDLLFQPANALHEEAVQVRPDDRDELQALEKRRAGIQRLLQHPEVEVEPGSFTIQVAVRMVEIEIPVLVRDRNRIRAGWGHHERPGLDRGRIPLRREIHDRHGSLGPLIELRLDSCFCAQCGIP